MKRVLILCLIVTSIALFAVPKKVAYVINGSLGDQSFYDSGYAGLKEIESKYDLQTKVLECNYDTLV